MPPGRSSAPTLNVGFAGRVQDPNSETGGLDGLSPAHDPSGHWRLRSRRRTSSRPARFACEVSGLCVRAPAGFLSVPLGENAGAERLRLVQLSFRRELLWIGRQANGDARAATRHVAGVDRTAVRLSDLLGDIESQSHTAIVACR